MAEAFAMRQRIRKIGFWILLAGLLWSVFLSARIWRFGAQDQARPADCIIVLGAAVKGAAPSPVFAERIRHGIDLYRSGHAPKILFTGGFGEGQKHSEGAVGHAVATSQGLPSVDVLFEEKSRTTQQNLLEASAVMRAHGMESAILVSDPLHMSRAMWMAEDLGIKACSSPTPPTRYRSLRSKLGFLMREFYFHHHYAITGN